MTNARARTDAGFTLLETVISLTILALLMLVLYLAFSTASSVWSRAGDGESRGQRQETVARLLAEDFRSLRPYTLSWERGQDFAFVGAARTVFYVTAGGLGAVDRASHGLFFACLFLAPEDDGTLALRLYKSPYPDQTYFEALHDFATSVGSARAEWLPPETLAESSTTLLKGLGEAAFTFAAGPAILPAEDDASPFARRRPLPEKDWGKPGLPATAQLEYSLAGKTYRALAGSGARYRP